MAIRKTVPPVSTNEDGSSVRAPRKRRKEARPGELQAAALELFVEKGFAATRLDDVAARAGVSKGTLYLYFDSKFALFQSVVEEGVAPILDAADHLIATHEGSFATLIQQLSTVWWARIVGTPVEGLTKLVVAEARNFPEIAQFFYDKVIHRGRLQLLGIVERAIRQGEFRPLDPKACVDTLILPTLMMAIWQHSLRDCGPMSDPKIFLPTLTDILLNGLLKE